jgi:AcrR family transcriptional regulator
VINGFIHNTCDIFPSMPRVVDVEQRRAELLDATARLIARSGIGAATMRAVAAEAGWTTGALTHYFADKRELLLHTFRASLEHRRARRVAFTDDPHAALRDSLEGALPLDEDRRRHWMVTIAFCAQAAGDPSLAAAQRDAYREFRARVTALVTSCGLASTESDPLAVAERMIAVADGIAIQALFDPESWPADRQLATLRSTVSWSIAELNPQPDPELQSALLIFVT